jgi:hypothetical protein
MMIANVFTLVFVCVSLSQAQSKKINCFLPDRKDSCEWAFSSSTAATVPQQCSDVAWIIPQTTNLATVNYFTDPMLNKVVASSSNVTQVILSI